MIRPIAEPDPEDFGVEYSYYDPDDLCRRGAVATYVGQPVTRETLAERKRQRTPDGPPGA